MGATQPSAINYDAKLLESYGNQSRAVGNGETAIIRSSQALTKLVQFPFEDNPNKTTIYTLWHSFMHGYSINPQANCLGFRPFSNDKNSEIRGSYQWLTYLDVYIKVVSLAYNLHKMKIFDNKFQENIGIFAKNRVEWTISMLSIWHQNHRVVPLYDTLGDEATKYILQQTGLKLLFTETSALPKIWKALETNSKATQEIEGNNESNSSNSIKLQTIVYFDAWTPYNNTHEIITKEDTINATKYGIKLIGFSSLTSQFENRNSFDELSKVELAIRESNDNIEIDSTSQASSSKTKNNNNNNNNTKNGTTNNDPNKFLCQSIDSESDLAIIMYTSGTTGLPKGVMLTHSNIVSTIAVFAETRYVNVNLNENDKYISYLPLAHIFEIAVECTMLTVGASIGYYQGNITKLTDDFRDLRPTILCGVPRVFQKVYDKVQTQISQSGAMKKFLIEKALSVGTQCVRQNKCAKDTKWDKLVFSKIRETAGWTDVRIIVSGAAPLPGYLMEFLQVVTSADVRQGYGMTETVCAGGMTSFGDGNVGHVGPPTPNCEIKLRDVPEMDYFHTDIQPRGEIMIRGPCIFQGYYKLPEKTNETLVKSDNNNNSKYNWIATGDIGRLNPNGTLTIIDRRKNIFKLAQGEYVAVEKIELSYLKISSINQIWVYGNSFKTILVAVVIPDAIWLEKIVKNEKWDNNENIQFVTKNMGSIEHCNWYKNIINKNSNKIKQLILNDMKQNGENGLKGFEKVKDIIIESEIGNLLTGFTVENDLLTPSMKLKRPMLLKKYVDDLKQLYTDNGQAPNENEHWIKN